MYTIILWMSEKHARTILHTFQHNYPNYTINFTISKAFPLNCIKIERNVLWICDRDANIQALSSFFRSSGLTHPDSLPLPVIAFSHEGNTGESLMGATWQIGSPQRLTPSFIEEVYCRCHNRPMMIVQTKRCLIRELTMEDLSPLTALQQENEKNPGGCFFPEDCAAPDEYLNNYIRHQYLFYGYGLFGIIHKSNHRFMGIVGFSCTDLHSADAEISYALLRQYQHQGYARETVFALLEEGRLRWQLESVAALIHEDNTPSVRLADELHIHHQEPSTSGDKNHSSPTDS